MWDAALRAYLEQESEEHGGLAAGGGALCEQNRVQGAVEAVADGVAGCHQLVHEHQSLGREHLRSVGEEKWYT